MVEIQDGIALSPASATVVDGLGRSPTDSATELHAALLQAGLQSEANDLQEALARHGVTIGL
jgi:hypothetical protein